MTATDIAAQLRPFTHDDWLGFAGAEAFADGSEPLIAEGRFASGAQRGWVLVLDGTGGCLLVEDDPQTEYGGYCLRQDFPTATAAREWAARWLGAMPHLIDFLLAGFDEP